jgi:ribosomal protein S18 acetylase RimI-like enzyme
MQQTGAYLGRGPWDDDVYAVEETYLHQRGEFLIGEWDGLFVAMGGFRRTTPDRAEIKRMRVHPDYQGRGLGQIILTELEARAQAQGYSTLHLDTSPAQVAAQRLYEKNGFYPVGRTLINGLEVILYEKSLGIEEKVVDNFQIQTTDQPAEEDWQLIEENIDRFNIQTTGYDDYIPLAILVRDASGTICAGLTAFTWGGTLRIRSLWVQEDLRKQGHGSRLLEAAEQEARNRGCKQAVLETHSFQAPRFYPARGYTVTGVTDDNPVGFKQLTFQKRLIE